eukprot:6023381-Amphidinium_carterae.1
MNVCWKAKLHHLKHQKALTSAKSPQVRCNMIAVCVLPTKTEFLCLEVVSNSQHPAVIANDEAVVNNAD